MTCHGNQLLANRQMPVKDATVTTMLQVATLMQQCMRQQVKLVVVCVMAACTTQWAETVNSVNHSSIKTQTEK